MQPSVLAPMLPFLEAGRYKACYGGRGGGKSHFFAEYIIARAFHAPTRIACIREVQNSIRDSVRQLLMDKIQHLDLGYFFNVTDREITAHNGSLIVFKGMQSYNAENIKSLEAFDVAWVEEAQTMSAKSLRLLRPTIRKEGSELLFSWNPRYPEDPVDMFFRGPHPPTGAAVIEVNWRDNPLFPKELHQEKADDFEADPEMAEHVWNGGYEIFSEASYFIKQMAAAEKEGRIGDFPYQPHLPVQTAWDIGVDDYTAIWFIQEDGENVRIIDYYEASGDGPQQIVPSAMPELDPDIAAAAAQMIEIGRLEPYLYGEHFVPHDVKNREWGAGGKERTLTLIEHGVKNLHVGVATNPANRIDAVRRLLPVCHFNNTGRVQVGISRLRRYSRKLNETMGLYSGPLHDINSHGCDAFGEFAINCRIKPPKPEKPKKEFNVDDYALMLPPPPGMPERPPRSMR